MATPPPAADLKEMDLIGHLGEMRRALVVSAVAVVGAAVLCFTQFERLMHWLIAPLPDVQFIFTSPAESFMASLSVALAGGILLAMPVLLHQLYWFISPGLTRQERLMLAPAFILGYLLFMAGVAFAYFALLPVGVTFLIGFAPAGVTPMLSIGNYLGFSSTLLLATGVTFELPLILGFLAVIGLISSQKLLANWRIALLASFIVAAIVTPSIDIFTQTILAGALMALYGLSIQLVRLVEWLLPNDEDRSAVPGSHQALPRQ